jgi:hypothetical protein
MRGIALIALLISCSVPSKQEHASSDHLSGRFLLRSLEQPSSTKPESFNADDWAKGLMLPQQPSAILIDKGAFSSEGVLSLSGPINGQIRGDAIQFTIAEESGGTRLEIQFNGNYNAANQQIEGQLVQQWGLTQEDDSGGVTLSAKATFSRAPAP